MRVRLALTLAAVMAFAVSLPGPAAAALLFSESGASGGAGPSTEPTTPDGGGAGAQANWTGRYSMYRARTHSVQKTNYYCVPTSIQMMLNLINGDSDRSRANQTKYWEYAQTNSKYPVNDNGADAGG